MLQAAIVGLGWWGKTIVQTMRGSDKLRIVMGVDTSSDAAGWARDQGLGFTAALADALADPAIGAVILCTPHSTHGSLIARAAAAKKHVFCEKPLALSRREAIASVASCNANGVVLGIGHERRFEPPVLELTRMAKQGELGTLLQIEASFCQDKFLSLAADNWRLSGKEAPAGPMTATGIHLLDLAVSLLGPAARAHAAVRQLGSSLANGDTLGALVTFKSGANALICAILATPFAGRFTVYGNKGWVEIRDKAHPDAPQGWVLTKCLSGSSPVSIDYPPAQPVRANLEAFADAASGGAPYPIPQGEMIANIAALEAIVSAAASGGLASVED